MSQVTCPGRNQPRREGAVQSVNAPHRRGGGARGGWGEMPRGRPDTQATDGRGRLCSLEGILRAQPGGLRCAAERMGPWGWKDLEEEVPGEGAPPGGLSDPAWEWGRGVGIWSWSRSLQGRWGRSEGRPQVPGLAQSGVPPSQPTPAGPPTGLLLAPRNWASPWSDPGDARPTRRRSGDRTGGSPCRWLRGTRAAEASTLPAQALRTSAKPLLRSRGHRRGVPSGGGGGDIIHLTRLPAEIRQGKGAMPWAGCPPGGGAAGSRGKGDAAGAGAGLRAPSARCWGGTVAPSKWGAFQATPPLRSVLPLARDASE